MKDHVEMMSAPEPDRAPRRPRLLYVEDDGIVASAYRRELARAGFDVTWASTLARALEVTADGGIDAIVTDWNLAAGVTAEAVVARARDARIPTVVFSGAPCGVLPWIEKTDLAGIREWLRSTHAELTRNEARS